MINLAYNIFYFLLGCIVFRFISVPRAFRRFSYSFPRPFRLSVLLSVEFAFLFFLAFLLSVAVLFAFYFVYGALPCSL